MPRRDPPISVCYKCFAVFHANKHWCPECGDPSPRGTSHLNKLQEKK